MKRVVSAIMMMFLLASVYGAAVIWHLQTENSSVSFNIKNFGKKVEGTFGGMKADIKFDEKNPEQSRFSASIQVKTIDTGNKKRDKDLMGEKYFDAEKYPLIEFKSKSVSKTSNGYLAKGDLSIKGTVREADIPFTFEKKGDQGEFVGTLSLNRHDYSIGGNTKIMGDQVEIRIKAEVNK
ncbi:MAG: YceI family protein [Cytophagaceae bacterium]